MGDSNMCAHYQAPTIKSVIEGFLGGIKDTEIGTLNKAVTDVWPGKIAPLKRMWAQDSGKRDALE